VKKHDKEEALSFATSATCITASHAAASLRNLLNVTEEKLVNRTSYKEIKMLDIIGSTSWMRFVFYAVRDAKP